MREYRADAETGLKPVIRVMIDGEAVGRSFRNKGEALEWLRKQGYTKQDIARNVRFI